MLLCRPSGTMRRASPSMTPKGSISVYISHGDPVGDRQSTGPLLSQQHHHRSGDYCCDEYNVSVDGDSDGDREDNLMISAPDFLTESE